MYGVHVHLWSNKEMKYQDNLNHKAIIWKNNKDKSNIMNAYFGTF